MKKKAFVFLVTLIALVAGGYVFLKGRRFEVSITQERIDSSLSETFPMSKQYLFVITVRYQNPEVTLLEDENRIQVGLDAELNIKIDDEPKALGGGVTISTGIRYDSETKEFFLDDVQLERLDIQGVPKSLNLQATNYALKAAQEFIQTPPVYKLEGKDAKMATAKMLLKGFEVRDGVLVVTLGI